MIMEELQMGEQTDNAEGVLQLERASGEKGEQKGFIEDLSMFVAETASYLPTVLSPILSY